MTLRSMWVLTGSNSRHNRVAYFGRSNRLKRGSFLLQSDGNNCGPIVCLKIMELFHAIDVEAACEVYEKKNIRQFVMAEWDKLVEHCSNDLPVFVFGETERRR